jgi:hypothetical protein
MVERRRVVVSRWANLLDPKEPDAKVVAICLGPRRKGA